MYSALHTHHVVSVEVRLEGEKDLSSSVLAPDERSF